MSEITPQQMRELADDMDSKGHHWSGQPAHDFFAAATALRTAADEQERQKEHIKALQKMYKGSAHEASNLREKCRTAAAQLEAVQAVLDEPWEEDHDDAYYLDLHTDAENRMRRILAADTMPQRGRDE